VIGEVLSVVAALGLARVMQRAMDAAWDRHDKAARVIDDPVPAGPVAPTVRLNCALHGPSRALVAAVVVDLDARPCLAHIPCGACGGSREVPVSPAVAVWLAHHGAQRVDDLLARAVTR
jgi:hypothetical protein